MDGLNIPQTFREICPLWTRRLETYPEHLLYGSGIFSDGNGGTHILSIARRDSCVAGEAHGFSSKYMESEICWTCDKFGYDFAARMAMMTNDPDEIKSWEDNCYRKYPIPTLQETIDAFTKHFEENHIVTIPEKHLRVPQVIKN